MLACAAELDVTMAHSPEKKRASASLRRPEYVIQPFFTKSASISICATCCGELMRNSVLKPPMPFSCVPIGRLCQALKFSMCTHDGQPVEYTHCWPEALSLPAATANSFQVFGAFSGSSPAFLN